MNGSEGKDRKTFFVLVSIAVVCQIIITPFLLKDPQLWTNWISMMIYTILGYVGMRFFLRRTGFPGMVREVRGIEDQIIPISLGFLFAVLAILFDIGSTDKIPQMEFPISLFAYIPVAIMDNFFWKLFLMTSIIFLISRKMFKGKHENTIFRGFVIFYILAYMMIQFGQYSQFVGDITIVTMIQIPIVSGLFILTSCLIFRRYGFLASVLMHLSQYLIYHGLYGGLS